MRIYITAFLIKLSYATKNVEYFTRFFIIPILIFLLEY